MHKRSAGTIKNATADKTVFDALLGALIASPPIRKDDLKPKRKKKRTKKA